MVCFKTRITNHSNGINCVTIFTLGSIVQSVNGPNLIISELTNNINIVQGSTARLEYVKFNASLGLFIDRLFSSKRQALPKHSCENGSNYVRVGPELELPENHFVMAHLKTINSLPFSIHETSWKNKIRFSIYNPNSPAQNCDSCLLFKDTNHTVSCGFIVAIVCYPTEEYRLVINKVYINRRDSLICNGKCVINPFIFWGHLRNFPRLAVIPFEHVVVKLGYKKEKDFFHFFQFPNTAEST